ncbi:MAG: 2-amino-4-hydroxy-6-hydroxymethyldihydropteridine diphosphokinase [Ilumatobacteraceae bacterium]
MHVAHVALGSNLGDREAYLRGAVHALSDAATGSVVVAMSQVFETDPVGGPDGQGAFLNMAVTVHTEADALDFLHLCQSIEASAHRQREVHWGPRTLDVDLLHFDDLVLRTDDLELPHPRIGERRFVLAPLSEIAPEKCPEGWDEALPPMGIHPRGPLSL